MALVRRPRDAEDGFFPGFEGATEIGVGRLATVFAARDTATQRVVALKLLTATEASAAARGSFEREAMALGAVGTHPGVVTLFRSFPAPDGRPVLALELCRDLFVARGRRMHVADVVELGTRIAAALDTVHRAGFVHRDVKPANILRTEFGDPVLADFGAARLPAESGPDDALIDLTSPHAAPELLSGGHPSPATDVYGLASTLYELLAGRPAFGASGVRPAAVTARIRHEPVPPPAAGGGLAELLVQAMSVDPADRPSVAELRAGLAAAR